MNNEDYSHAPYAHTFPSVVMETGEKNVFYVYLATKTCALIHVSKGLKCRPLNEGLHKLSAVKRNKNLGVDTETFILLVKVKILNWYVPHLVAIVGKQKNGVY